MKAIKRDKIALAVALALFVLAFVYAVKTLPSVEGKLDGQGNLAEQYQSDDKIVDAKAIDTDTVAGKWPMEPPKVEAMSNWSVRVEGNPYYRYVKIDGQLAIEIQNPNKVSSYYTATVFFPAAATPSK